MSDEISTRYEAIIERVTTACSRAGREPMDVSIVAVSKNFGPDDVREAADCGMTIFGESRVQEARQKIPMSPGNLEWHLIGHLQTNKVKPAVNMFSMIHSVDSLKLLQAIDGAAGATGKSMPVCLEVNVSGEGAKFGLPPDELGAVLEASNAMMNVDVVGLMTVPPFTPDTEDARAHFAALRQLRDDSASEHGIEMNDLSMGMSQDFEIAIEEGATWVRLGSALFGKRSYARKIG